MPLSAKTVKAQLAFFKPIVSGCSLKTIRIGQNKIGDLMEFKHRDQVISKEHKFDNFDGSWMIPKDERRQGVILYLHGGGYTCGGIDYAQGFGSTLADKTGTRVFCCAYRLAPENPFPAALDDAFASYKYLLEKGYSSNHIMLCGESAGGGLCYSLCLKLKKEGISLPSCIVAISPWTDLTASGESYEKNCDCDPTMTKELLGFFADSYTDDRTNPYVSPMFANLKDMPPSLIFVGKDEIMLSDSVDFHKKLLQFGNRSKLVAAQDRWHGYLLYEFAEDEKDFELINRFINKNMVREQKLRWLPLDNAAKIYPAARRENWSNVFRLSATLNEEVDTKVLQLALDVTVRRFPSIAVKLRKGVFWYYLQRIDSVPCIMEEYSYPLTRMSKEETGKCAFRVIVYNRRIAIEIFHSLTDGTGAMVFLKSLIAEYLQQRHGIRIPAENGVLGRLEEPSEAEIEDSFQKYASDISASRKESNAWHMYGTPENSGHLNVTCFRLSVKEALDKAHEYNVSLTTFLSAAVMMALQELQNVKVPNLSKRKPVKLLIPVNLRQLFPSKTLRNFAFYTTPEIVPGLGEYDFAEICKIIHHHMGSDVTAKQMSMKIAANVKSERLFVVRVMPLFIKNIVMKAVFDSVGEKKSCLSLSNLGNVKVPDVMAPYIERFDFILGVQATAPYNCGVISYGDHLNINFIRNIKEPELEYWFCKVLEDLGLKAEVQSNKGAL